MENIMLKIRLLIGLLSMGMIVMLGPEANARVCTLNIGGTCFSYSGSVECDLDANHVGNLANNPKLSCDIAPQATTSGPAGVLLCGNPGNTNPSPGVQVVQIFSPVAGFGASQTLTKNDKQTGGVYT